MMGESKPRAVVWRALAGIECGVLGGLAMLACWAAGSVWHRQPPWIVPNILGSLLYRHDVLRGAPGAVTLAGTALHISVAGAIGLAFGLLAGDARNRLRAALLGVLTALLWYYCAEAWLWRPLGALALIYNPPRALLVAHLIFGLALAGYGRALDRLHAPPSRTPEPAVACEAELARLPDSGQPGSQPGPQANPDSGQPGSQPGP